MNASWYLGAILLVVAVYIGIKLILGIAAGIIGFIFYLLVPVAVILALVYFAQKLMGKTSSGI